MEPSRRKFVTSGAGIIALSALAGCAGDEGNGNGSGDGNEPESTTDSAVVTMLAENLSGGHDHDDEHHDDHDDEHHDDHDDEHHDDHDDEHHDDHDDEHHDDHDDEHHDDHDDEHHDDHDDGMVSQAAIDEACGHIEFDESEALDGGASVDSAPVIDATHQPFDVTVEAGSAYVSFDVDAYSGHDHDDDHDDEHHGEGEMFGFFVRDGDLTVHEGELHEESHDVGCSDVDTYVVVEPDHGAVTLELTPDE